MSKKVKMHCIKCRKMTEHIPYCEEREMSYLGYDVDYTEEGWICAVCGDEQLTCDQFDKAMAEIKETYYIKKHS